MDKASRAIRRSGVKLLSLSGGHADLNVLVSDVKDVRSTAKAFMNAQSTASQDLMKWVGRQENRAIEDVVSHIAELNLMWTEAQRSFVDSLKDYKSMFDVILDGEKEVANAKSNLFYCVQKEEKIRKELQKASKRGTPSEIRILEARLSQLVESRVLADGELKERVRETEAVKLTRMKDGLLKMSESYMEMATKCCTVFTAQRDVALQLPDVLGRDLERLKYSGSENSRQIVDHARDEINSYTRRRRPSSSMPRDEPPPPYTPPEPANRVRPPPPVLGPTVNQQPIPRSPSQVSTSSRRSSASQHSHELPIDNELPAYAEVSGACQTDVVGSSISTRPSVSPERDSFDGSPEHNLTGLSLEDSQQAEGSDLDSESSGSDGDGQSTEQKQCMTEEGGIRDDEAEGQVQEGSECRQEQICVPKNRPVPSPRQCRAASYHDDEYDTAEEEGGDSQHAASGAAIT